MEPTAAGPDLGGSAGTARVPAIRDSAWDVLDTAHEAFISIGLLRTLAEAMDWELGVLWLVNEQSEKLVYSQSWQRDRSAYDAFVPATQTTEFGRGVGLPGRTWILGEPQCLEDVQQEDNFPRIAEALKEGLHGAIAFPVFCAGEFVGVFDFFGRALHPGDSQLLGVLDGFRTQIGQFVERTRAEEQLAHQAVHDSLTGLPNRTLFLDRLCCDRRIPRPASALMST
jgi:GAF domain-containing protein